VVQRDNATESWPHRAHACSGVQPASFRARTFACRSISAGTVNLRCGRRFPDLPLDFNCNFVGLSTSCSPI
jgi:hypothetical protein